MFGNSPYYFSTIRKMEVYFATLFNDIYINRYDSDGDIEQTLKIPLTHMGKDKMLLRVDADPNIERPTAIVLPAMSYEMVGLYYDGNRKLNAVNKYVKTSAAGDANKFRRQFTSVPYNFEFNLYVYTKHLSDSHKIIEQILPFFTPDFTATINLIPEMSMKKDCPVILNDISFEDLYDSGFEDRRAIVWTLSFTIKGYMFGPIVEKPIIKVSNTQFYLTLKSNAAINNAIGNTDPAGRMTVTPGLDANGNPTTNSAVTIPWAQITVDDNYTYIVEIEGQIGIEQ